MPAVQMSILEASQAEAESFVHPLSPVQEQATEAIVIILYVFSRFNSFPILQCSIRNIPLVVRVSTHNI